MTKFISLFLKILVTIPVVALLIFITLGNQEQVLKFKWSPIHESISLSLPIIIFISVIFGFVWGSLILWSNTLDLRADRRAFKKKVSELETRLEKQRIDHEREMSVKAAQGVAPKMDLLP